MIAAETRLTVTDNSGIAVVKCIRLSGCSNKKIGRSGDVVICSVIKKTSRGQQLKARVYPGLIVRVKKNPASFNGVYVKFSANSVILFRAYTKRGSVLIGKRLRGPFGRAPRPKLVAAGVILRRTVRFF